MGMTQTASGQVATESRSQPGPGMMLRQHWLLALLLAAGVVLRVMATVGYRPVLLFTDSLRYLYRSGGNDPVGYRVLLRAVLLVGNLDMVAVVQHLLGLGMAVALYILLQRRGVARWLAALACAPVLLDGYQLQLEQSIMPDVLFEALIVTALVILLWQPRPRPWMIVAGGLALGCCAPVAEVGQILILPALVYVIAVFPGWRQRLRHAAVLCVAFALPIMAYCTTSYVVTGHFRLANQGTNELYGRAVLATNCRAMKLPADERPLCPTVRLADSLGIDGLVHSPRSPLRSFKAPPGMARTPIASSFTRRLLLADPVGVVAAVLRDALHLFALQRVVSRVNGPPVSRWQFQTSYPTYLHVSLRTVATAGKRYGGGGPTVDKPLASILRSYQLDGGYTPGPVLALAALAGLAGSIGVLRRRATSAERSLSVACLLTFSCAVALLLVADTFEFSWRYQLPALVTLVPAGALGITAVRGYLAGRFARTPGGAPSPS
jgi:hypothetical protein